MSGRTRNKHENVKLNAKHHVDNKTDQMNKIRPTNVANPYVHNQTSESWDLLLDSKMLDKGTLMVNKGYMMILCLDFNLPLFQISKA